MININVNGTLKIEEAKGRRLEQVVALARESGAGELTPLTVSEGPWNSLAGFLEHSGINAIASSDGRRAMCRAESGGMRYRISIWHDQKNEEVTYTIVPLGPAGSRTAADIAEEAKKPAREDRNCWMRLEIEKD